VNSTKQVNSVQMRNKRRAFLQLLEFRIVRSDGMMIVLIDKLNSLKPHFAGRRERERWADRAQAEAVDVGAARRHEVAERGAAGRPRVGPAPGNGADVAAVAVVGVARAPPPAVVEGGISRVDDLRRRADHGEGWENVGEGGREGRCVWG
jgi:hypothetical protein